MLTGLKRALKFALPRFWTHGRHYSYVVSYEPDSLLVAYRHGQGAERRIRLRQGSDGAVFTSIFGDGEYAIDRMARGAEIKARYDAIVAAGRTPLIVDAGANVGLATLYFRDAYPKAAIVAIEPEPGNFAELQARVGDDALTMPLRAALAREDGTLDVLDPGEGAWGFRTGHAAGAAVTVPAHSPETILAMAAERWSVEPLLFKIDIEGFEADLFDGDAGWIDRFPLLIIELHDWMLPGKANSRSFLKAVADRDRDFVYSGENVFSFRNG